MVRPTSVLAAVAVLAALTVSNPTAPASAGGSAPAQVRVVHGSPDAGPVTVSVNGSAVLSNFTYGTVTPYIQLTPGQYTLAVTTAGGASVTLTATVNAGTFYSIVATGELSPKASPSKPNIALTAYVDTPFGKGSSVNFHHAAPVVPASAVVPFGFGLLSNPLNNKLGGATFGKETGPIEIPKAVLRNSLELYAVSVTAITLIPNQVDPKDYKNILPAPGGANISVYAIDGPAAASTPSIAGTDAVRLVGAFDAAGV